MKKVRLEVQVFDCYYFQGYTISEIARKFELSESGIAARLRRARRFLCNELAGRRVSTGEMHAELGREA